MIDESMIEKIENWFTYHAPAGDDMEHYQAIRHAAKMFVTILADHTPSCADQTAAIRKVREAVMTANAAIACKGR